MAGSPADAMMLLAIASALFVSAVAMAAVATVSTYRRLGMMAPRWQFFACVLTATIIGTSSATLWTISRSLSNEFEVAITNFDELFPPAAKAPVIYAQETLKLQKRRIVPKRLTYFKTYYYEDIFVTLGGADGRHPMAELATVSPYTYILHRCLADVPDGIHAVARKLLIPLPGNESGPIVASHYSSYALYEESSCRGSLHSFQDLARRPNTRFVLGQFAVSTSSSRLPLVLLAKEGVFPLTVPTVSRKETVARFTSAKSDGPDKTCTVMFLSEHELVSFKDLVLTPEIAADQASNYPLRAIKLDVPIPADPFIARTEHISFAREGQIRDALKPLLRPEADGGKSDSTFAAERLPSEVPANYSSTNDGFGTNLGDLEWETTSRDFIRLMTAGVVPRREGVDAAREWPTVDEHACGCSADPVVYRIPTDHNSVSPLQALLGLTRASPEPRAHPPLRLLRLKVNPGGDNRLFESDFPGVRHGEVLHDGWAYMCVPRGPDEESSTRTHSEDAQKKFEGWFVEADLAPGGATQVENGGSPNDRFWYSCAASMERVAEYVKTGK